MKVPFLDLKAQYQSIKGQIGQAIQAVIDSTAFAGGPFVEAFEKEFAAFCQCNEAVAVGNGTDALWLALMALGIGPGDEVITVPNTFIATVEAISLCGARPVFVDVRQDTCTMDPELLEPAITTRTKAIIPVHLYGQCADMDPILAVARRYGLYVIEDACQAHGATYKGRKAGSMGHAGCYSFYPGKNLGAYGEAGAVVTNDPDVAAKIRMLRDHGQQQKYHHRLIGWNARMDGIQAAILSVKLRHLDRWNKARQLHASRYNQLLADHDGIIRPFEAGYGTHVYHIYCIRTRYRDELMRFLAASGVNCGIHYPVCVHLQEAYKDLGIGRGSLPVAEALADQILSLPMYPELTDPQIDYVVDRIKAFTVHKGGSCGN